jgi:hypothetical protein
LSGRLGNRSVNFEIKARGIPYARIHEEGGTITPKNAQYLAIPFPNSPAWNMAMTGKKVSPSDYEGKGFFKKSKNGNLIFFVRDRGSKDGLIPMFLMKESVEIPARHWISRSVGEAVAMLSARMLIAEKLSAFAKG